MDLTIAGVSAYQQSKTIAQVGVAVDAKVLNIARDQGQQAVQLLQAAIVNSGSTGASGRVDLYA